MDDWAPYYFQKFQKVKKSEAINVGAWIYMPCSLWRSNSTNTYAELIRAGLGPRKLSLFEYGDSGQFHDDVMAAFPKLADGCGYELMRTKQ